ncbi:hypothetical protein R6V09_41195 [Streptomyces sp. W16]|uniref:hypothetical protein n=1 Tax=Streptomyces sp. W16 TaxID=3076631 RepID=UPI00295B259E|nr:hypothetical protein [Streptomyces sp. W16]MDV9176530.1 hypothetical protein [Streptomyces sp. W16]
MTAAAAGRVGRFYTTARRHPWVLGKVADWRIPLGPYTPAQIAVAVTGGFLLAKTIAWWSWMGPVPIVAWLLTIWTVRRPKIRGRAPMQAALGWLLLGSQPRGGRIGGHPARDRAPHPLLGGFTIEDTPAPATAGTPEPERRSGRWSGRSADRTPRRGPNTPRPPARRRTASVVPEAAVRPVSGVQQLLALTTQDRDAR